MDREVVLLQQLRRGLTGWLSVIRRATGARQVSVALDESKGLSIVGVWIDREGTSSEHTKIFAKEALFGHTLLLSPAARRLMKKPCDCAKEFIRDILTERGVIS